MRVEFKTCPSMGLSALRAEFTCVHAGLHVSVLAHFPTYGCITLTQPRLFNPDTRPRGHPDYSYRQRRLP